jgi:hypothetical protein
MSAYAFDDDDVQSVIIEECVQEGAHCAHGACKGRCSVCQYDPQHDAYNACVAGYFECLLDAGIICFEGEGE